MPTIRISEKTKKRLTALGKFGMSYDDVINSALDYCEVSDDDEEDEDEEDYNEDEE
jgi:hypothetical protein